MSEASSEKTPRGHSIFIRHDGAMINAFYGGIKIVERASCNGRIADHAALVIEAEKAIEAILQESARQLTIPYFIRRKPENVEEKILKLGPNWESGIGTLDLPEKTKEALEAAAAGCIDNRLLMSWEMEPGMFEEILKVVTGFEIGGQIYDFIEEVTSTGQGLWPIKR